MKTSLAGVAVCLTVGLVFVSGCERATEPDANGAFKEPTARAAEGPSTTTALPDLTIDANRLQSTMVIREQRFKSTSCALDEGCVDCVGKRKLLKFEVFIPNRGDADLVLGNPADPSNSNLFVFSPCHGHYHVIGFTSYELLNSAGTTVLTGRKQAFCLEDFTRVDPGAGSAVYTCANQGIKVGWADVYAAYLDCQWIDITDVQPGDYRLKITINATPSVSSKLTESDYSNNTAEVPVTIPAGKTKPSHA
jgi:hypothetical protein